MEYISDSYFILSILIFVSFCAGFIDSIAGGGGLGALSSLGSIASQVMGN